MATKGDRLSIRKYRMDQDEKPEIKDDTKMGLVDIFRRTSGVAAQAGRNGTAPDNDVSNRQIVDDKADRALELAADLYGAVQAIVEEVLRRDDQVAAQAGTNNKKPEE